MTKSIFLDSQTRLDVKFLLNRSRFNLERKHSLNDDLNPLEGFEEEILVLGHFLGAMVKN